MANDLPLTMSILPENPAAGVPFMFAPGTPPGFFLEGYGSQLTMDVRHPCR